MYNFGNNFKVLICARKRTLLHSSCCIVPRMPSICASWVSTLYMYMTYPSISDSWLLQYSRVHAQIALISLNKAQEYKCGDTGNSDMVEKVQKVLPLRDKQKHLDLSKEKSNHVIRLLRPTCSKSRSMKEREILPGSAIIPQHKT